MESTKSNVQKLYDLMNNIYIVNFFTFCDLSSVCAAKYAYKILLKSLSTYLDLILQPIAPSGGLEQNKIHNMITN